jgi:diguanylate cyclase (GGDEF)-like protein
MSNTDYLTGCFNRQYLQQNLDKEIKRSRRYGRSLSILLCDIDHFKEVNDRHGHQCGDQVLIDFTNVIRSLIRENIDWLARYGGEEFLLVLPETDAEAARAMAERLRCEVAGTPLEWRNSPIAITASFGTATFEPRNPDPEPTITSDRLIQIADQNLYRAKSEGRNRVVCGG